jgi:cystathionine beta-lyase/cystathionine gamma-synthase
LDRNAEQSARKISSTSRPSRKSRAKIISVSDNTFATPWIQRPIEAGFDMVIHSATKYLNGHSDMVGGVIVVGENKVLADQIAFCKTRSAQLRDRSTVSWPCAD